MEVKLNENANLFVCYLQKLAQYLNTCGFEVVRVVPNRKYPRLNVWYFAISDDLIEAINIFDREDSEPEWQYKARKYYKEHHTEGENQ